MTQLRAIKMFYSAREGLVTLEDDVLSIVRSIRESYGDRITVHWEPTSEKFVFVENCADGAERLIFVSDTLDARILDRLHRADSQGRGYIDTYEESERDQDRLHAEIQKGQSEQIYDMGERVAHALRQDGIAGPMPLKVAIPRSLHDA